MVATIITVAPGPVQAAQVAQAAAALDRGELVALPTETVYGIAARMDRPAAVAALRSLKQRADDKPFTLHLATAADAARWAQPLPPMAARLAARYWPGPITLVVPGRSGGTARSGEMVGLRVPARDFTRAVIQATGTALYMSSANRAGAAPLWDPAEVARQFGEQIAWLFDGGSAELREASTVVRVTPERFDVLREGILSAAQIAATASQLVLFVCSGNTCRSPMAAALFQHELARRLGCAPDELPARGVLVQSAGLAAADGDPASDGSVVVMDELQVDVRGHRSRQVTRELLDQATVVYAVTRAHRDRLLRGAPEHAAKVQLLAPQGTDIQDPFGGDEAGYRVARDAIRQAVAARVQAWPPA